MIATFSSVIWTESCDLKSVSGWNEVSPREQKFLDSQTRLLFGAFSLLTQTATDLDRERAAIHLAVGPARTDREAMLRWATRVVPGESFPMVQPAGAVGLLPNTPLSWLSIKCGLRGEGGVWAGLAEAGFAALSSAMAALEAGAPEAIVMGVNDTDSPFVRDALQRGFPSVQAEGRAMAVALRLRPTLPGDDGLPGPRLLALDTSPADTPPGCLIERLLSQVGLAVSPDEIAVDAWYEGIGGRTDISDFGDRVLTPLPLLALHHLQGAGGDFLFSPGRVSPWALAQAPERAREVLKAILIGIPDGTILGLLVLFDG